MGGGVCTGAGGRGLVEVVAAVVVEAVLMVRVVELVEIGRATGVSNA